MNFRIEKIKARQVLDSRGNPTVEALVYAGNAMGRAVAPSGASKGKEEAVELRDGEGAYHGKSVHRAIENIATIIAPALVGMDVTEQETIDDKLIAMDGTKNKRVLGANACIAVSVATCKCAALCRGAEPYAYLNENATLLPIPFMNVINGGMHAGSDLAIQEHMIAPVGAESFEEAVQMCCEIYHTLKTNLAKTFGRKAINVGDEGGFAPPLSRTEDALEFIMKAIEEHGYEGKVKLALDAAASSFYENGTYVMEKSMSGGELLDYYVSLCRKYPIVSLEDAFDEEDWDSFVAITEKIGNEVQIVGDDIFVTNAQRLRKGIKRGACNALLLKPNQIGTLSETIRVAHICNEHGYAVMVSHRSGDTCDDFIADLAVALETGQIKSGAPARGERVAKYNRLLAIEETLERPRYAGVQWHKRGL
ncbi:MAG TPA: phosphopyruvate hydratase [Thermoplasmatales archaeon]|nr:phosphopyruvate hydratase [Thermoplasmatales archaeon]